MEPAGVDGRRHQVVSDGDGVDVTGQMEVELVHRDHLAVAAAGGAALDPEGRAHRWLANAGDGVLADRAQALNQTDGGGGLALAERRGGDGGDVDVLAARAGTDPLEDVEVDLGLGLAERDQVVRFETDPGSHFADRQQLGRPGDLDVTR